MTALRPTILVLYDAECAICRLTMRALARLDWLGRLEAIPLQRFVASGPEDPTRRALRQALHVRDERGRWTRGGQAALRIARAVPIFAPLWLVGSLPGMHDPVELAYRLVAANRRRIGRAIGIG